MLRVSPSGHSHRHHWNGLLSRRELLAGSTAFGVGLALAGGLRISRAGAAGLPSTAIPIEGGTQAMGPNPDLHLYGPTPDGSFDPIDAEPVTVGNFNGRFGLAYISGTCTRTNSQTHVTETLPFAGADMRFMKGTYRGSDNLDHEGTFAFI